MLKRLENQYLKEFKVKKREIIWNWKLKIMCWNYKMLNQKLIYKFKKKQLMI